jgi:Zn-dependent M28 family amino/carboxypeptidase
MKYITPRNIAGALVVVAIAAFFFFTTSHAPSEVVESNEEFATQGEDIATTTATSSDAAVGAISSEFVDDASEVPAATPSAVVQSAPVMPIEAPAEDSEPQDLGPRQPATTPIDALKYAAEAAQVGDIERALSYISTDVRDNYRTSFTTQYEGQIYPVLLAYLVGKTDPVELVQPEHGLYQISVYPSANATLGFSTYYKYDGATGEFVITEL